MLARACGGAHEIRLRSIERAHPRPGGRPLLVAQLQALLLDGLEREVGLLRVEVHARVLALQFESCLLHALETVAGRHFVLRQRSTQGLLEVLAALEPLSQLLLQRPELGDDVVFGEGLVVSVDEREELLLEGIHYIVEAWGRLRDL